jgi:galactose-1-phosphate uridylyltransferase
MEVMGTCIVGNLRREETLEMAKDYLLNKKSLKVGKDFEMDHLIRIYRSTRRQIFKVKIQSIEKEKSKYLNNILRLARKAEEANDFRTARDCYKDIATLLGVFKEKDDSKIILNFSRATISSN